MVREVLFCQTEMSFFFECKPKYSSKSFSLAWKRRSMMGQFFADFLREMK